jgi:PRTRC genetic system protein E
MFGALLPLVPHAAASLSLIIVPIADGEGGVTRLRVTVIPKGDKEGGQLDTEKAALRTPLQLEGTADELDAGFATAVQAFASVRRGLQSTLATATVEMETASAAARKKGTDARDRRGKGTGKDAPAASAETAPKAAADGDLFGSSAADEEPSDTGAPQPAGAGA